MKEEQVIGNLIHLYLKNRIIRKKYMTFKISVNHALLLCKIGEQLKQEVKRFSIHYTIKSQKSYKDQIKNIENEIIEIESLPYLEINMNKKQTLERQLSDVYDRRAKGAQIRSRAKWTNEGEKNTKFFLGLEKSTKHRILFMN